MNWSPSRIAECRKALEDLERHYARKDFAKAVATAEYLHGMAGQAAYFLRMEAGVKKTLVKQDPPEVQI